MKLARQLRQMLLQIGETFGHSVDNHGKHAWQDRHAKRCPFRDAPCNKGNNKDPLGICSFADEKRATVVCPSRFLDQNQIFRDASRLAFGAGLKTAAVPEVRVLTVPGPKPKKIGKIDFMLTSLDASGKPVDFAALEIQAVYISGKSIKPAFDHYSKHKKLPPNESRRPDFRSSAQKRLMPQLSLKVPIFRRWGKKFFVAVDETFFEEMPNIREVDGVENSEVTWLVYSFDKEGCDFKMKLKRVVFTHWDEVVAALREGVAPKPSEMLNELAAGLGRARIIEG
jgi:hypothetical protein